MLATGRERWRRAAVAMAASDDGGSGGGVGVTKHVLWTWLLQIITDLGGLYFFALAPLPQDAMFSAQAICTHVIRAIGCTTIQTPLPQPALVSQVAAALKALQG